MTTSSPADPTSEAPIARVSVVDAARVVGQVLTPLVARGLLARRPRATDLAGRVDADARAVQTLRGMRERYGDGLLLIDVRLRRFAFVLDGADVRRVLDESPEPFSLATTEKRGALAKFQPHGVLISDPPVRGPRRDFNEAVLDYGRPVHHLVEPLTAKVTEEADILAETISRRGELDWDAFITAWWRVVRRVVLGDAAREDHALTDMLTALRQRANWSWAAPTNRDLRARFLRQLRGHLGRGEAGSLAELVTSVPADGDVEPEQQVPQWLFAFEPAGMAALRALFLLASHSGEAARAAAEVADDPGPSLPFLRGCVLESVRLWPTTPAILRETTTDVAWGGDTLRAGTTVVVYAPLFHRDPDHVPGADRFVPDRWNAPSTAGDWPLIPFSAGPGTCPGRDLVLLATTTFLSRLLAGHRFEVAQPHGLGDGALPGTLSPYRIVLRVVR